MCVCVRVLLCVCLVRVSMLKFFFPPARSFFRICSGILSLIIKNSCNYIDTSLLSADSTANGEPAVSVQETKIDLSGDGVAVIGGEPGLTENSSEVKLLREESRESRGVGENQPIMDRGVLNPIREEMDNYPDAAAPYLVSC